MTTAEAAKYVDDLITQRCERTGCSRREAIIHYCKVYGAGSPETLSPEIREALVHEAIALLEGQQ